jgi:hypothetical protein
MSGERQEGGPKGGWSGEDIPGRSQMIKVVNEVNVLETNGQEVETKVGGDEQRLIVASHWNYSSKVVLAYGGETITVNASDLIMAVENARNTNRLF